MTPSRPTICLCMIVKNEIAIIERCLASVADHVGCWVICDTGSTDGTPEAIERFFAARGIAGELHHFEFETFEQARNRALDCARASPLAFDYFLFADADMELRVSDQEALQSLTAPAYSLLQHDGIAYSNLRLLRRDVAARYRGVTHEYLDLNGVTAETFNGAYFIDHASGNNRAGKFERDANLLSTALTTETDPGLIARYTFYLAQSYRDAGQSEAALDTYLRRATLGFWIEEVYYSLLQAGRLMEQLQRDSEEIFAVYQRASATCSSRAEAAHAASRLARNLGQHRRGFEFAQPAIGLVVLPGHLFAETWVYAYAILDEYAVNAYWAGEYRASAEACRTLLSRPNVPEADRTRTLANLEFALAKLEPIANEQRPSWRPNRPLGGTELMVEGLRSRLGRELDQINLHINAPGPTRMAGKPLVIWVHHDVDQAAVQWMSDRAAVADVTLFVFVSYWQRERYLRIFGLAPERCIVLRNAISIGHAKQHRRADGQLQVAYTSTPFRGLSVLLDAWQMVAPENATLHIWSSMTLYGPSFDDTQYQHLFERASTMKGVRYEGLLANDALKERLRTIDILAYPSTFAETSCVSVIEAMNAGCRVICPSRGALPETTFNYARIYAAPDDAQHHAAIFARELAAELASPWNGAPHLGWQQQDICHTFYDWDKRVVEWRNLIRGLTAQTAT